MFFMMMEFIDGSEAPDFVRRDENETPKRKKWSVWTAWGLTAGFWRDGVSFSEQKKLGQFMSSISRSLRP